ncbi:MAG: hypothetical protein N3A38_05465 [Planctomycetota bacterium]|nr:hypothetical protein [Planctomycetota bacterium]
MPWADIVGQEPAVAYLRSVFRRGRLAHGYLFAGPAGTGKRTAAGAFAAAFFCRVLPGEGCGACRDCSRVASGQHPDLFVADADPSEREIRKAVLDALTEAVHRSPLEGRGRVAIVPVAERMNETSANMLLKTLEEPPPATVLILTSEAPEGLPETVRSRLQRVRFGRLPAGTVARVLREKLGMGAKEAETLAAMADGSIGRAIRLAGGRFTEMRGALMDAVEGIARGDFREFARTMAGMESEVSAGAGAEEEDGAAERGEAGAGAGAGEGEGKATKTELRRRGGLLAMEILRSLYRDAAAAAAGSDRLINPDFRERAADIASRLGLDGALEAMEHVSFADFCIRRNCHVDLVCRVLGERLVRAHGYR